MGNQIAALQKTETEAIRFSTFLQQRKKKAIITENLDTASLGTQKKWRNELLRILKQLTQKKQFLYYSNDLTNIIQEIKTQSFIKAISIFHAINSTEVQQLIQKPIFKHEQKFDSPKHSKYIDINFQKKFSDLSTRDSISTQVSPDSFPQKVRQNCQNKFQKKNVYAIILKQINQSYHPFLELKQAFLMMFQMKYRLLIDSMKTLAQKQKCNIYQQMNKDITNYTQFIASGSNIYKKWILKYSKIRSDRYPKYIKQIILDSLFQDHSLHSIIFPFLKEINRQHLSFICSRIKDNMSIQKFNIRKQLQIQGDYLISLHWLGQIDHLIQPKKVLQLMEKLKDYICQDIDNYYYQMFNQQKKQQVDSDNLFGILCFLLCKLKSKILEIYSQLIFLLIVYGEQINTIFQRASYMVATIEAIFDYLQKPEFLEQIQ